MQTAVCYRCADCSVLALYSIPADAVLAKLLSNSEAPPAERCLRSLVVLSRASIFALGSCRIFFGVDHYPATDGIHQRWQKLLRRSLVVVRSASTCHGISSVNIPVDRYCYWSAEYACGVLGLVINPLCISTSPLLETITGTIPDGWAIRSLNEYRQRPITIRRYCRGTRHCL